MVLLRRSSIEWIYTRSLSRKLYSLDKPLKSLASLSLSIISKVKVLDRSQVPVMFVHWILFSLLVKHTKFWRINFFCRSETSAYLVILESTCGHVDLFVPKNIFCWVGAWSSGSPVTTPLLSFGENLLACEKIRNKYNVLNKKAKRDYFKEREKMAPCKTSSSGILYNIFW